MCAFCALRPITGAGADNEPRMIDSNIQFMKGAVARIRGRSETEHIQVAKVRFNLSKNTGDFVAGIWKAEAAGFP